MTRLITDWIKDIENNIEDYQMELEEKCGYDLLGLASRAVGVQRQALIRVADHVKVGVVPVTAGEGLIGCFAETVAAIVRAMGPEAFVTEKTDVAGLYEAGEKGADIVFTADDQTCIAMNLKTGYMAENNFCTAAGFVTALEGAAKKLRHKKVLVLGGGTVGKMAFSMLAHKGAWVSVYDKNEQVLEALADEGYTVVKNQREIIKYPYILDATSEGGWLTNDMLRENVMIVALGVPISLTGEAYEKHQSRLIFDYLNIGIAVMLGAAAASGLDRFSFHPKILWRADRIDRVDSKSMQPGETPGLSAIEKSLQGLMLTTEEIINVLSLTKEEELEVLFSAARSIREKQFQDKIFLYGFIYLSTWCRKECHFCYYRRQNTIERYRKTPEEILKIAELLAKDGVHLIDLTMGEDPLCHEEDFAGVIRAAKQIRQKTGLPVMVSPGVVKESVIDAFEAAGVEWYALYQETFNREIFKALRHKQDYDERMDIKHYAKAKGLLTEEGLLIGAGESKQDIAEALIHMGQEGAVQMRAMTFVPQAGTPMEHVKQDDFRMELKIIALLRLLYPNALIPASLDVEGREGLESRIMAGANVVTSIIPPKTGLSGVAQATKDVQEGGRTVKEVKEILKSLNMRAAGAAEYKAFMKAVKIR